MVRLICGNSLNISDEIPDLSIDAIVTSPRYNIGAKYDVAKDKTPFEQYLEEQVSLACLIGKKLKKEGHLFLVLGKVNGTDAATFEVAQQIGWFLELQQIIIWVNAWDDMETEEAFGHVQPKNSQTHLYKGFEYIFHYTRTGVEPINRLRAGIPYKDKSNASRWKKAEGKDLRPCSNAWYLPYSTVNGKKDHPASFPVELPLRCLKMADVKEGSVVLDPFCGTGATLEAAQILGADSIGIDLSENYLKLAQQKVGGEIKCLK